jgi:hypothetical protein
MLIAAILLVAIAGYAQYRIPFYIARRSQAALTRGVLAVVGIVLGYLAAATYPEAEHPLLTFLAAFGIIHVPAAIILFVKWLRGAGRS